MDIRKTDYESLMRDNLDLVMESCTLESAREKIVASLMHEIAALNFAIIKAEEDSETTMIKVGTDLGRDYFVTQEEYDEIISALTARNKIPAIKLLRSITGLGLKESKYMIEVLLEKERST